MASKAKAPAAAPAAEAAITLVPVALGDQPTYCQVVKVLGRTGSRGGVTQVKVRIDDTPGSDNSIGGETGETRGDTLDASTVTQDSVLDLSLGTPGDPEDGRLFVGGDTMSFQEIETIFLGAGNDSVIGSSGNDNVHTGNGADTVDGGAGDDRFDLGAGDGAVDVAGYGNGDGHDTLAGF